MSMELHLRRPFHTLLAAIVLAGPLSTASLSQFLARSIPGCAQSCLDSFIVNNFPLEDCASSDYCICTTKSDTGYTVGEGALSCVIADCDEVEEWTTQNAYQICNIFEGVLPSTHSILTVGQKSTRPINSLRTTGLPATRTRSSSSQRPSTVSVSSLVSTTERSSISSVSSSTSASSDTMSTVTESSSDLSSSSSTPSPSSPSPTTISSAPASSTASAAAAAAPVLTKAQIAGVVVASTGAAALAFGLGFLFLCWRRKRAQRRNSGSSFGESKDPDSGRSSPDDDVLAARDVGHDPQGKEVATPPRPPPLKLETPVRNGSDGWSQWKQSPSSNRAAGALAATTPKSAISEPSPITPMSHRTQSQLLPDKPTYSVFPGPHRPNPSSRRASQNLEALGAFRNNPNGFSPPMKNNPRFPGNLDTSQSHMQQDPYARSPSSPPQIYTQFHAARPRSSRSGHADHNPGYVPYQPQPNSILRKPLPAPPPPPAFGPKSPSRQFPPSPFRAYPPPPPPLITRDFAGAATSGKKVRRQKSNPRSRPDTWFSSGSSTTIEDMEEDDNSPEPVSALSPVPEHFPQGGLSPVMYPPVPRSASESPSSRARTSELPSHSQISLARLRDEESAEGSHRDMRNSAKWKILVEPGLRGGIDTSSTHSRSPNPARSPPQAAWHDNSRWS